MTTTTSARTRRALVLLAVSTATLLPAAPALAQTATPPPASSPVQAPTAPRIAVDRSVIDVGSTHLLTVSGQAGQTATLYAATLPNTAFRQIRQDALTADGAVSWPLAPGGTTTFYAVVDGVATERVTVRVRRTVTIGIGRVGAVYVFSGSIARAEAGVQVTVARLDDVTKRVTGVASTRTTADGRYEIRTSLPAGLAGYYALTSAQSGLDAGRSRLYGLLVNVRPVAVQQSVSLDVRRLGEYHVFSGTVTGTGGGSVPITLARVVGGRAVGVLGGRTNGRGGYSLSVPLAPGTYAFQVLTATAKSRVYGLSVPGTAPVVSPQAAVTYADCDAVRRAGAAPIRVGDPGYGRHLDRDGDGRGCAGD